MPLLWALGRATSRREALRLGLLAGLATNVPAFYWLVYTIHVFGGFPYPLALFFYACLSLFSAMQFVLFAWGFHRLRFGPLGLFAPVLWVALEFLFPNLFPWRMANSQLEMPVLMQIGDLAGPYLLSFVMVWVSAGIALALSARRALRAAGGGRWRRPRRCVVYGLWRMPMVQAAIDAAPTVRVGLVQGNVGIHEKGNVVALRRQPRALPRALGAAAVAGRRPDLAGVGGAVVDRGRRPTSWPTSTTPSSAPRPTSSTAASPTSTRRRAARRRCTTAPSSSTAPVGCSAATTSTC